METLETPPSAPELGAAEIRPLLPPALLGPGAILWLWMLPILVLLALNVQGYQLIEGNMNDQERGTAFWLGGLGLFNLLTGVGLWAAMKRGWVREPGSAWWGLPAVAVQVGYLWFAMSHANQGLLPNTVTQWIYPPQRFLYNQFAFAMPALFWGMARLACARPAREQRKTLVFSLWLAVGAPVLLFVVFQVARKEDRFFDIDVGPVLFAILLIGLGLLMFVGLIRLLAAGLRDVETWGPTAERVAILVFALAMPMGGLLLNQTIPFPNDFQAWEVYALTAINAAMLWFASWQHARRPLLSFGLLCATLPFTLYFFVVFLPFIPLSILAVVLLGAGFLVLTPTVLLIVHLSLLGKTRRGARGPRAVVGVLCFLLLPGFFTVRGLADKAALNAALDYLYAPAIKTGAIEYSGNRANLRRALTNHRSYKNGIYYPLLSDYYAWLVFDHLVLPDDKLDRLETAFFGGAGSGENDDYRAGGRGDIWGSGRSSVRDRHRMPRANPPPRDVVVDRLDVQTAPADGKATVVTMVLTLRNTGFGNAEYIKLLPLPAGVFVSGFRLHVNGHPVPGRITEKKTALWVYSMIRDSERRDPGLLFYNAPDELELRVFPVAAGTPGVVEIDFLVPAERTRDLAGTEDPAVVLTKIGDELRPRLADDKRGRVAAGGLDRLALPTVKRPSYVHVIVDRSAGNGFDGDLQEALRRVREKFNDARFVRVTLANYETLELAEGAGSLEALPLRGGLVADLALAQAIRKHRDADLDGGGASGGTMPRPIFVVLGKQINGKPVDDLRLTKEWTDLVPGLEIHGLDAAGAWRLLADAGAAEAPLLRLGESVRPLKSGRAVRFKAATAGGGNLEYWEPDTGLWQTIETGAAAGDGEPWTRAMGLQLRQQDYARTPGNAEVELNALVKESRESGVMLASTSYIVVENTAQWRMLDVSERKKLDQNAALDFKEAPVPPTAWLVAGFVLWLGVRRWRTRATLRGRA